MSSSNPTISPTESPANDIWRQHETQIRDLYQNKRKTLKEVKAEMEKQGFPKKPLSTWESKLRADLRIRKKNKATDWPLIYQHLVPRLEKPGKKKLSKLTTIRLDGKVIPYDGAWKEIRRLGVHKRSPRQLPQGSLPHGIEVRTPSPVLSQRAITEQRTPSVASTTPMSPKPTTALQLYATQTAVQTSPPHITSAFSTISAQIPNIHTPWMSLCHNLQNQFHGAIPGRLLCAWKSLEWWKIVPLGRNLVAQDIQDFQSRLEVLPVHSPRLPRPSHDLGYRLVMSRGNVPLSDFVSTSIYLLSNRLYDRRDGDKGLQLLCLLFEHEVPLFVEILLSEPTTGKAAWESLFRYSKRGRHSQGLKFLLNVGISCAWLNPHDTAVLVSSLQMDYSSNIIAGIIDHLCPSDHDEGGRDILDAILLAHRKGRFDIAKLLVQRFDINADGLCYSMGRKASIFTSFILDFHKREWSRWDELDFFLSNGANVDKLLPSGSYTGRGLPSNDWYNKSEVNRALRPTLLDLSLFFHRSLFEKLAQHSRVSNSALTRSGLKISLEKGVDAFREYLKTRKPAIDPFNWKVMRSPVKLFLYLGLKRSRNSKQHVCRDEAECSPDERGMSFKIVRSLIQYIVDLNGDPGSFISINSLMKEVLRTLCDRSRDDGLQILDILMKGGANITESHLTEAVRSDGTGILEWLQPRVENFSVKAARALATAARLNNFEAVEFLLQNGANPEAFIVGPHTPWGFVVRNKIRFSPNEAYSVQAVAAGVGLPLRSGQSRLGQSSLRMSQFLAERGAKLIIGSNDSTPFEFIAVLLSCWGDVELFAKVKFALNTLKNSKNRVNPPAYLLELCAERDPVRRNNVFDEFKERMKIFEYLLDEGADVNPGSPLAVLVRVGGPKELVERVLSLGGNLNAFNAVSYEHQMDHIQTPLQAAASQGNEDLVYLFLKQGANVNSPARGIRGRTALQAICFWYPATEQEHRRKMTICELLLSSGAKINAAPARHGGLTALQAAVITGDLELVAILIRNGAHVNAPPVEGYLSYCALDAAAYWGRLDIAKLLLDANAFSGRRGTTGYDGAISIAERWDHHALAGLLRGYHRNAMEPSLNTQDNREAAEDYHIPAYIAEDESTDDNYWPEPVSRPAPTDDDWSWADEESSSSEGDAAEHGSTSGAENLMHRDTTLPEDTQAFPDSQVVKNAPPDTFMGYSASDVGSAGDRVDMSWENELMPGFSMGSLAETRDSQAFPDLQVVANNCTDDRISGSGTGFVLTEEEMQMQWGDESMLQTPSGPWAEMPDDSELWQRVFEEQDREFGFATFDAGLQTSSSDHFGEPETEGRDAELQRDWRWSW